MRLNQHSLSVAWMCTVQLCIWNHVEACSSKRTHHTLKHTCCPVIPVQILHMCSLINALFHNAWGRMQCTRFIHLELVRLNNLLYKVDALAQCTNVNTAMQHSTSDVANPMFFPKPICFKTFVLLCNTPASFFIFFQHCNFILHIVISSSTKHSKKFNLFL